MIGIVAENGKAYFLQEDGVMYWGTFTTSKGGRTTATIPMTYDALYDDDSSLAAIAGNYVDTLGIYGGILNIAGNGDLFLQDPNSGCVLNGRVAVITASFNAYDVQFT